jgi:hypothetical protein
MQKAEGKKQKAESRRQRSDASRKSSVARNHARVFVYRFLRSAYCLLLTAFCLLPSAVSSQQVVDKMVATVNAGLLPECRQICLITYSDLLWQLALQPNTQLDNPSSVDLNRALSLVTDQRLILQEAEKLPSIAPTAQELKSARDELVKAFPSASEFQQRLQRVGLTAEKLDEILEQRVRIEKYLDFRFRNFVVITQKEIADYYKDVYVPRLRARAPGQIVPTLEQARGEIERTLTEAKIESDTDAFLDSARERAEIVILSPV